MNTAEKLTIMERLGKPTRTVQTAKATLSIWQFPPISITQITGSASTEIALEIEKHYVQHFQMYDKVVTIHEWSGLTDYDTESRKILQQLVRKMESKQQELVLHLGKANSPVQQVIRTAVQFITQFRKVKIEIFEDDDAFSRRMSEILSKYQAEK